MKGAPDIKILFFCEWRVQSPHCLCTSVPLGFLQDHCHCLFMADPSCLQNKLTCHKSPLASVSHLLSEGAILRNRVL